MEIVKHTEKSKKLYGEQTLAPKNDNAHMFFSLILKYDYA